VTKDYVTAYMWLDLSAAAGNANAGKTRDTVARKMTPAQLAKAKKLRAEWKPK
jgi:hypothetical protein